ncbi:MAG: hypothetical protein HKN82_02020 [Akkermansiaceae bacterium]|nr:hypothetical protein [Akkermansiaceae bacterium]
MTAKTTILLMSLTVLLAAAEAVRLWWYGAEAGWEGQPVLRCRLPAALEPVDLGGSRAPELLSYDAMRFVHMKGTPDEPWRMETAVMEYKAGNRNQLDDIFNHSPEICMRGSGATLERIFPHRSFRLGDREFKVRHLVFRPALNGRPVDVFKFAWFGGMEELGVTGAETDFREVRFQAARGRHRHSPALLILANVAGARGHDAAWEVFRDEVLARCAWEPAP